MGNELAFRNFIIWLVHLRTHGAMHIVQVMFTISEYDKLSKMQNVYYSWLTYS